ncbi:unnamed protein product [Paramecium sonneborni]|uniref:Peptidase M16 C-terminal domain-containing protein n=1 Tax=Paramecium sonneborni TaxID=65129 RepID=A0A8S1JTK9_9CILI|nr:unnamed protein product [Paramecium sonneborni]
MISKFHFSNTPRITTLNSGITLYTKSLDHSYGSYCIMFKGGTRTENQRQQGSLLTLKIMQHLQINKFLFDSQCLADFTIGPESHNVNCKFLNEDFLNAAEYTCKVAFQKQKITQQFQKISNYFSVSQQKYHGSLDQILLKVYLPQISLLYVVPENDQFEKYQTTQITKNNCIIGYQGRRKHEEIVNVFEDLTNQHQEFIQRVFDPNYHQIENFKSKTIRIENQISSDFEVILLFQGPNLQDEKTLLINTILREILGNLEQQDGEIGFKVKSRCYDKLLQFNNFLTDAGCVSQSFTDFGIFGLYLKGMNTHKQEIYDLAIEEMNKLRSLSDWEIIRAKNIVITKFYTNLQRQHDKLIYDLESIIYQGKLNYLDEFKNKINEITRKEIMGQIDKLICFDKFVIIYIGKGSNLMPDEKLTMMRMKC